MKTKSLTFLLINMSNLFILKAEHFDSKTLISKLVPDQFVIQFAGNIGFLSAGIGYSMFNDRLKSNILLGYVPKFIVDKTVTNLVLKNTVRLVEFKKEKLKNFYTTIGATVSFETGNNTFLKLPEKYPDGYYSSNAFIYILSHGLVYKSKTRNDAIIKRFEYYAEIGTLIKYLYYNIKRKDYFNTDIISLDLGIYLIIN